MFFGEVNQESGIIVDTAHSTCSCVMFYDESDRHSKTSVILNLGLVAKFAKNLTFRLWPAGSN